MNLYDRLKRVVVEFSPLGKKGFGTVSLSSNCFYDGFSSLPLKRWIMENYNSFIEL